MYFVFSMTIFSFKEFILQKLNAKPSIHTVGCGNEISSSWSKYAESVCTPIEVIPSSISIPFMGFERVYQGTSHNVSIRGIGQLPANASSLQWNVAMHWALQAAVRWISGENCALLTLVFIPPSTVLEGTLCSLDYRIQRKHNHQWVQFRLQSQQF